MPKTHLDNKIVPVNYLSSQNDEIDWGNLCATLADNKWLITFIAVVALAIGIAKALLDEPVNKADAMLHVKEKLLSPGALEPLAVR